MSLPHSPGCGCDSPGCDCVVIRSPFCARLPTIWLDVPQEDWLDTSTTGELGPESTAQPVDIRQVSGSQVMVITRRLS